MSAEFQGIYETYRNSGYTRKPFKALVRRFKEGREKTFVEAAAVGAAVAALDFGSGFDPNALSPELSEAFHLAFPNLDIADVGKYSGDELEGLLQPWKGKLFEISVRDRLNGGEWVGDYHLEAGQHADLAASATQPAWDLQILNEDGSVADLVQLKSTSYISYVEEALRRYPDVDVLATSEVSSRAGDIDGLSVSDISNDALGSNLADSISPDDYGLLSLGLPLLPLALNAYWVVQGQRSVGEATGAVALSGASIAVGHVAGGVVADSVGDAILDGVAGLVVDGVLGFGFFTLGRWLLGGLFGESSSERLRREAAERQWGLERQAIDSTCQRIGDAVVAANRALGNLGTYYLPAPSAA